LDAFDLLRPCNNGDFNHPCLVHVPPLGAHLGLCGSLFRHELFLLAIQVCVAVTFM
jgi:hypothetical protein